MYEKALIQAKGRKAKENRLSNANAIFRDVSKPRALPVSTVVVNQNAVVTDVSVDGLTIQYQPALAVDEPVSSENGLLQIAQHSEGTIVLSAPQAVEPGEHLRQAKLLGDLPDVFTAFDNLWRPMWQRHKDQTVERWLPVLEYLQESVPAAPCQMELSPTTRTQWHKAVQGKKASSATGPDGISKLDLLHMPPWLTDRLVDWVTV